MRWDSCGASGRASSGKAEGKTSVTLIRGGLTPFCLLQLWKAPVRATPEAGTDSPQETPESTESMSSWRSQVPTCGPIRSPRPISRRIQGLGAVLGTGCCRAASRSLRAQCQLKKLPAAAEKITGVLPSRQRSGHLYWLLGLITSNLELPRVPSPFCSSEVQVPTVSLKAKGPQASEGQTQPPGSGMRSFLFCGKEFPGVPVASLKKKCPPRKAEDSQVCLFKILDVSVIQEPDTLLQRS